MMKSNIKKINVTYNSMDDESPLTNGDTVEGEVTVEVEKECRINSLYVKFKGKANVLWSETNLNSTKLYRAKVKYFSVRHYFVNEKSPKESHILTPGIHVYPFCYQFPEEGIPSSFYSRYGSVTYSLEAVLSRKMSMDKKSTIPINFFAKIDLNSNPELMEPKSESLEKTMTLFTAGSVAMDVNLERTCFFQGEELSVSLRIQNNSPHDIKPKYSIYKKTSYFARKKRKCQTKVIVNEVGTPIPPSASENVTKVLTIPKDVKPSIHNCKIIKVEYRLKVYLDVKRALDPEIKIEIVILPS
uniref:Arrestin C-terminal-like domain-containing protein n=1 Tax=Poecilia formosa TaxID=48698 RepID=A0A096MHM0_POEFO